MAKKPFELKDTCDELEGYIKKAASNGQISPEMLFSLVQRTADALKQTVKRLEEIEDRLDGLSEESGSHSAKEHH